VATSSPELTLGLDQTPNFVTLEQEILDWWEANGTFDALRQQVAGGPVFRFLDGPITANNPMGVHHARGRSLKDTFLRYKTLRGYTSHFRNGFDTQGLWIEVEVERELGFGSKRDIERYGLQEFSERCKDRVRRFAARITEQSRRLGQWMDWDNSYYTHTDGNIVGIWRFLKTCHEAGWIYRSHLVMPWCPRCGTSLSEHELSGSYREMEHRTVIVGWPLLDEPERRLLAWTTTPWTLAANVAVAVDPDAEYCDVRLPGRPGLYILARDRVSAVLPEDAEVVRSYRGSELIGQKYDTRLDLPVQQGVRHPVIAWPDVDVAEGTGLVHIAPGCGREDFGLATPNHLDVLAPIDEEGKYVEGYGWLTGGVALDMAEDIIDWLSGRGVLFTSGTIVHSYPVCWRCKHELVFRLVDEWFINTDPVRPRLLRAADGVQWDPPSIGRRMADWLTNMGDWCISRRRYWGLPLPFYPCPQCNELTVVGSREELERLAGKDAVDRVPELHRPWIDAIQIECPRCGGRVSRITEVGDVWLDAGIVPYTTLGYFDDREAWQRQYPAEWVTEMAEQVRLWWYSMLFMGVTLRDESPYERVLAYERVVSEEGTTFSKTGTMIEFDEAAARIGADAIRYLFAAQNPASEVRFGFNLGHEVHRRLLTFWNCCSFFTTYAALDRPRLDGVSPAPEDMEPLDRWLLARTQAFVTGATAAMDAYRAQDVTRLFEGFVDDVSNWYIRTNRHRFWKAANQDDQRSAYWALYTALRTATQVMAPVLPFLTEHIWQHLVRPIDESASTSVHLAGWPASLGGWADAELLDQVAAVRRIVDAGRQIRTSSNLRIRMPLKTLLVAGGEREAGALRRFEQVVQRELNVRHVETTGVERLRSRRVELDPRKAGPSLGRRFPVVRALLEALDRPAMERLAEEVRSAAQDGRVMVGPEEVPMEALALVDTAPEGLVIASADGLVVALDVRLDPDLVIEGTVRDLIRQVQVLRKEVGLRVEQRIALGVEADSAGLREAVERFREPLMAETLALALELGGIEGALAAKEVELELGAARLTISPVSGAAGGGPASG
jgi:isoleucyl-tRNA synthetase